MLKSRRRWFALVLGILAVSAPAARSSFAQGCPVVEINCSGRSGDTDDSIRCVASVSGNLASTLTYQWSVSVQATLKNHGGFPDQVEIDLTGFPHDSVNVSVSVKGLPEDCTNTATFESKPVVGNEPALPASIQPSAPTLIASCSQEVTEGMPLSFSAQTDNADTQRLAYQWRVSRGIIKSGQGTHSILMDTADLGNQIVRATVMVEGAAPVSCATLVRALPKAYKLDEYSGLMSLAEKRSRLNRFFLRLKIGLDERAYIIAFGRKGTSREEAVAEASLARDFLVTERGIAAERVITLYGEHGKNPAVELWIAQDGASPPTAHTQGAMKYIDKH